MKMHVISILVYYYYYLSNVSSALSQLSYLDKNNELQNKINRWFHGKQSGKILLDIDEYEYPRTNETLRQFNKQQWLDYYACLKRAYTHIGRERIIYPNALTALEGTSVTLNCEICISPMEMRTVTLIEWYFNNGSKDNISKSIVEDTDHTMRSSDNQYIVMYNLKPEQAGLYWCEMGDTTGSVYYLYIDNDFEAIHVVYLETAIHASQAAPAESVPEYQLKIYTTWTMWGSCSTCDRVGIKFRLGYCTISLLETTISHNEHNALQYTKKGVEEYEWNQYVEDTNQTIMNENLRIRLRTALLLFRNKLPCKSKLVPKQIQRIPGIKHRRTEMMRRYCKKKCRKNILFEVRDESGNILESANNSAGIYSMVQGIPKPSPSVTRITLYEKHNKKFKLVCPGHLNVDVPIIWQIDDKIIIPSYIEEQSNRRIRINPQMHIIFQSLKFEDANIYSCWQDNEIAGIIKLNVTGEIELKLNHHVILIGATCIISVFLIIFWRTFKGRMRYTMH